MVPFLLRYGRKTKELKPTTLLSYVEYHRTRTKKKHMVRVYDSDYEFYDTEIDPKVLENRLNWAIPVILYREWDWGDLQEYENELAVFWLKNAERLPGIQYVMSKLIKKTIEIGPNYRQEHNDYTSGHFIFDPATITEESASLFLSAIGGSIKLGPSWAHLKL